MLKTGLLNFCGSSVGYVGSLFPYAAAETIEKICWNTLIQRISPHLRQLRLRCLAIMHRLPIMTSIAWLKII